MDLLGCAGVVVGGAGHTTVQKSLAWGVPLVARAWLRRYDRQELRLRADWGRSSWRRTRRRAQRLDAPLAEPAFVNGAGEAVARIARKESSSIPAGIMNE